MPVAGLRSHAQGIKALFSWMTENWDELCKRLPPELPMLGTMVMLMTSGMTTESQLADIDKFFGEKNNAGYDKSLEQSKDAIRSKISWLARDRDDVARWLKENQYA